MPPTLAAPPLMSICGARSASVERTKARAWASRAAAMRMLVFAASARWISSSRTGSENAFHHSPRGAASGGERPSAVAVLLEALRGGGQRGGIDLRHRGCTAGKQQEKNNGFHCISFLIEAAGSG